MQWEHTSRAEAGETFWNSQVVLKTQPKRAVSGTGLGSARCAVTQAERQSTRGGCENREIRANTQVGVKLKTCGLQDGTGKEGGWGNGTDEMPERCFCSSVWDSVVAQGLRRECRRDVVCADHGLDWHPGGHFRSAVKRNQQNSVRASR